MTYLIKYVFQIKQKIQIYVFKLQEKRIKNFKKDISCKCNCKFDGKKCTLDQWWNNNKCGCDCKKHIYKKEYTWNLAQIKCRCEYKKYYICEKHYLWNPTTYIC